MKKHLRLLLAVSVAMFALAPRSAGAQANATFSFHTAGQVKAVCEQAGQAQSICDSQLQGAFDMAEMLQNYEHQKANSPQVFCPNLQGMNVAQLRQNYLAVANGFPNQMDQPFSALFLAMLVKAYPCQ